MEYPGIRAQRYQQNKTLSPSSYSSISIISCACIAAAISFTQSQAESMIQPDLLTWAGGLIRKRFWVTLVYRLSDVWQASPSRDDVVEPTPATEISCICSRQWQIPASKKQALAAPWPCHLDWPQCPCSIFFFFVKSNESGLLDVDVELYT